MQITRHSIVSGKKRTWNMDITSQQIEKWRDGMLIQDAMPNLSDDEGVFPIRNYPRRMGSHYGSRRR